MCNSVKSKILSKIYGHGRGWTFSANDFLGNFKRQDIDNALVALMKQGTVRHVFRGIYDYPVYSELLKTEVAPDINNIAFAIARKFRWQIYPTGDTVLSYFGLSTQIPGRVIYLTDGSSRKFETDSGTLEF